MSKHPQIILVLLYSPLQQGADSHVLHSSNSDFVARETVEGCQTAEYILRD